MVEPHETLRKRNKTKGRQVIHPATRKQHHNYITIVPYFNHLWIILYHEHPVTAQNDTTTMPQSTTFKQDVRQIQRIQQWIATNPRIYTVQHVHIVWSWHWLRQNRYWALMRYQKWSQISNVSAQYLSHVSEFKYHSHSVAGEIQIRRLE